MGWSPTVAYIELVSESQCDNRAKFVSSEAHVWEVIDMEVASNVGESRARSKMMSLAYGKYDLGKGKLDWHCEWVHRALFNDEALFEERRYTPDLNSVGEVFDCAMIMVRPLVL